MGWSWTDLYEVGDRVETLVESIPYVLKGKASRGNTFISHRRWETELWSTVEKRTEGTVIKVRSGSYVKVQWEDCSEPRIHTSDKLPEFSVGSQVRLSPARLKSLNLPDSYPVLCTITKLLDDNRVKVVTNGQSHRQTFTTHERIFEPVPSYFMKHVNMPIDREMLSIEREIKILSLKLREMKKRKRSAELRAKQKQKLKKMSSAKLIYEDEAIREVLTLQKLQEEIRKAEDPADL